MASWGGGAGGVSRLAHWLLPLWWLTVRRRWRRESGAALGAVLAAVATAALTLSPPPAEGQPLYHTAILLLLMVGVVFAPLLLSAENVIASQRMQLLPIPPALARLARLVLGNSLRSLFGLLLVVWGCAVLIAYRLPAVEAFQLFAWLLLGLALSQFLEDVVRHGRAVVIHQILFLIAVASWPLLYDTLRNHDNFAPAPEWSTGALHPLLFGSRASTGAELGIAVLVAALAVTVIMVDARYLRRASEPAEGNSSAAWTAALAGGIAALAGGGVALRKELLVLLRFLFLRATLVLAAITVAAAFFLANPYLLLLLPVWWQSLATNALAPDVGSGELRYHLLGQSPREVLPPRLAAQLLATAAIALAAGIPTVAFLGVPLPTLGTPTRWMYPLLFVYALSLMLVTAIVADRYSLRYPDPLEMGTLLPERQRGTSAAAILLVIGIWWFIIIVAAAGLALAALLVRAALGPPLGTGGIALVAILGASFNAGLYLLHLRHYFPRAHASS